MIRMIKSQRKRWSGNVSRTKGKSNAYKIFVRKQEEKKRRGSRRKCEDNIKINLTVIGRGDIDWIHLAEDMHLWRVLVKMVMKLRVP
jgi:hypothetical protein